MKKIIVLIALALCANNCFAQKSCNLQNEYAAIFTAEKVTYGEREFLDKKINKLKKGDCFEILFSNNLEYINYLLSNFWDYSKDAELLKNTTSESLQNAFINAMKQDTTFNNVMNKFCQPTTNKAAFIPDTFSTNYLVNIAVKFFSIIGIDKDGYYEAKVCAGINDIKKTEEVRKPQLEAFCFSTIFSNYQGAKYNMYNEMVNGVKECYKLHLGIDTKDRLLRAQGAMYMAMRNNKPLKEMLMEEYENKKQYLPFVIKEN